MMGEINRPQEWNNTIQLMRGLFPRWTVSPEQLEVWRLMFGMHNPDWLREAIQLVYTRYSSDDPKPKWLVQAFKEVKAGYQGIPLDESVAASENHQSMCHITEMEMAEAQADQERMHRAVAAWDNDQRIEWADKFKKRFPVFATRNDSSKFDTWSRAFAGFVYCLREMDMAATA